MKDTQAAYHIGKNIVNQLYEQPIVIIVYDLVESAVCCMQGWRLWSRAEQSVGPG